MDGDHLCRQCDSTGWVLYRSETKDGEFEEAYRLCPKGHMPRYCMGNDNGCLCPRPATVRHGPGYYCKERSVVKERSRRSGNSPGPGLQKGEVTVNAKESSAPHAHLSASDHDDTVETHYSALERLRPHACMGGWVFIGYIDEHGQERVASYRCRRCTESPGGQ